MRFEKNILVSALAFKNYFLFISLIWALGCSSARVRDREVDDFFRNAEYEKAAQRLEQGLKKQGEDGKDLLLYLLDLGLTYQLLGKYEDSNRFFEQAEKIAEIKDYTSLSQEAATFISSENIKSYKGEEFELILISTYRAINYALMQSFEAARVEARKVNSKLYRMIHEGGRKYQESAFARYLSGVLFETDQDWNNALVSYKKTFELIPAHHPAFHRLCTDLWRMAKFLSMPDEQERFEQTCKLDKNDLQKDLLDQKQQKLGEIIVIYQNGIGPEKIPNPQWSSIPEFVPRYNPVDRAEIILNNQKVGESFVLENIEATAIQNLREKYSALIAKKIAGVVAKEVVANQVEKKTKNEFLGALARLAMYAADQADLRSWKLLPRDLQLFRFWVTPGTHTLQVRPLGASGRVFEQEVEIRENKKQIVNFRYQP